MQYRTVTDTESGYVYGEWTSKQAALQEAANKNSKSTDLSWVEDEENNRVN
jgi:hypothetical protein